MDLTILLTTPPRSGHLAAELARTLCEAIEKEYREDVSIERRSLSPSLAWVIEMRSSGEVSAAEVAAYLQSCGTGYAADQNVLLQDARKRRKRLLVADMESTIIEQEMIDELADYVGRRAEIESITASAMRGELDFEAALRERVAMLAGLDARVLDEVYERRVTLMPGAETLIRTMKANGAYCALVSGGFTVFTERVAGRLGFDEHQANVLEVEAGRLTGRVREPILGRAAKRAALERLTKQLGLEPGETMAVGDGANDLDMLAASGLGVAFRAKPKVQEIARTLTNGAVINHGDLTALLYLQGYRGDEFVS